MDTAEGTGKSRVLVECTDPTNLLTSFGPLLAQHLPLRNLYWKSDSRPLRSIDVLDVALLAGSQSHQNVLSRRHQIPGLRQTPYVKLYLLRCNDKDTYKDTCRKQIRQWLKDTSGTLDHKASRAPGDQHDAFEWLVVHLVQSETPVTTQPSTSKHATLGTTDSTDSVSSKSTWPSKGSSTVFDKLRADFNSSSRSALERVAQVRLNTNQGTGTGRLASIKDEELRGQWEDFVEKLKAAILMSFSRRVQQYEDDIRQRESQRNLPGWNFCTYFILKEGLAHGFENIGLLNDAETIYDELDLELDSLIRDTAVNHADDQDPLLPFSKDLKAKIRTALDDLPGLGPHSQSTTREVDVISLLQIDADVAPFNMHTSRYTEMILANEISALDFRIHIFTRKLALLAPSAGAVDTVIERKTSLRPPKLSSIETVSKAVKISQAGLRFLGFAAQNMRSELYNAWGGQHGLNAEDLEVQEVVVSNIIASWSWYTLLQFLQITDVLPAPNAKISAGEDHAAETSRPHSPNEGTVTSVVIDADAVTQGTIMSTRQWPETAPINGLANRRLAKHTPHTGSIQLAVCRAQYYLQAREILKRVWQFEQLSSPWDNQTLLLVEDIGGRKASDVAGAKEVSARNEKLAGITPETLRLASTAPMIIAEVYERLSKQAFAQFRAAGVMQSSIKVLIDLAEISHWSGDFTTAASYCKQAVDLALDNAAAIRDRRLLGVYCSSLRHLQRHEDFLRFSFELLSLDSEKGGRRTIEEKERLGIYARNILTTADQLGSPMKVALNTAFVIENNPESMLYAAAEAGYRVSLLIRTGVFEGLGVQIEGTMRLRSMTDNHPATISLQAKPAVAISTQPTKVDFYSDVEVLGWYQIEFIELSISKLRFIEGFTPKQEDSAQPIVGLKKPILLYPSRSAPSIRFLPALTYDLAGPRELRIEIETHASPLKDCDLHIKPATAGLRLRTKEIISESPNLGLRLIEDNLHRLEHIPARTKAAFSLQYTMENIDIPEISAHVVLVYTFGNKVVSSYTTARVSTIVPLSINVRDVFKAAALFSCFTIASSTSMPLQVRHCEVYGSSLPQNENSGFLEPTAVFPGHPAHWTYRFGSDDYTPKVDAAGRLRLVIEFQKQDEIVLSAVAGQLRKDLLCSDLSDLSTALPFHLTQMYQESWTEQDLEISCLLHSMELWTYEDINWSLVLSGLQPTIRSKAQRWLRTWHKNLPSVSLSLSEAPVRRVSIPIEMPVPEIIVSRSLHIGSKQDARSFIGLGEAVTAELSLSYYKVWKGSPRDDLNQIEIRFEIMLVSGAWVLGRIRRGSIRLTELHTEVIPLLLIPQSTGYLPLPTVELRCFGLAQEGDFAVAMQAEVSFELDDLGRANGVLVMANEQYTTVDIAGAVGTERDQYSMEARDSIDFRK